MKNRGIMAWSGKKRAIIICVLLSLTGCMSRLDIKRKKIFVRHDTQKIIDTSEQSPPEITVFVHGACLFSRKFRRYIHCTSGLHLAKSMDKKYYYQSIACELHRADPKRFNLDSFYSYCWSGDLHPTGQKKEAQTFYQYLQTLMEKYQKIYNQRPFLRIIGYSHGCNMILNLAHAASIASTDDDELSIDQLILFAAPVQAASAGLIKHVMFKKIYSLYSRGDFVQVIDPQRLYTSSKEHKGAIPFFSCRRFKPCTKLKQVKIKIGRYAPGHPDFIKPYFLRVIPRILDAIEDWPELDMPEENSEYLLKIIT